MIERQKVDDIDDYIVLQFLPIAKYMFIVGTIGRVCIILVSLKKPGMCKIYHLYDLAMLICDFCIVQETTVDS